MFCVLFLFLYGVHESHGGTLRRAAQSYPPVCENATANRDSKCAIRAPAAQHFAIDR